ncbi:LysR family transcriptional regulator [Mucilaginibacter sp. JRF]|uniref:LysR family transcriptional regulator n=1 Tax=Mucilaginibacter sp. JRF TaxID=2780088 RepID=UPI001881224B|nr:LysR family transcriptional regulator [Mucilaginibacter sp. JRF]MBE9583591.1 LysR family transcriptional regulator [Mucilaginibacter sp. JRF]
MTNLEWFRTFKAIYETGSLTGAADKLYISQPGVSLHLSSLENYVGYKLFDRSSRRMVPTERAKVLYNFVLEPMLKLEKAEELFSRTTEKEKPTISIGMCFETFQFTLEPYLPKLPFNVIIKFGEYPEMLSDLDNGVLDMIITPQKGDYKNLQFKAFSKERIMLVAGNQTDATIFKQHIAAANYSAAEDWLQTQTWYGTAGDMEHLRRFWHQNFGKRPGFKPNFIVPNLSSIIRCLNGNSGLAVIPDFLSKREIEKGQIFPLWQGHNIIENTLYFAARKKTMYAEEIKQIEEIFEKEMSTTELLEA